jgi:hypothetical protein
MQLNTYFKSFVTPQVTYLPGRNIRARGMSLRGGNFELTD